jgi:hypothetical protein
MTRNMADRETSVQHKALRINLDGARYGTFAEIGAGQEVARWFFHVGGAAGTVAKTMSAYDMAVSDAIYGPADRYVSRRRLRSMLDHEFNLLIERLNAKMGQQRQFFAFADTVATRSYSHKEDGQGWMGIRFQSAPQSEPSEILLHVRLLDNQPVLQQKALGLIGVNLVYGAFYLHDEPQELIRSLLDQLSWERVEVDMIQFSGPAFAGVDNRLMALQLVEQDLTEAAMFTADGQPEQWSEALYKKPVLILRGSFHPVTTATMDVLQRGREQFAGEPDLNGEQPVVMMELTLRHLVTGDAVNHQDFIDRVDTLAALGQNVLVSNFRRFHRLSAYLVRYTNRPLGITTGASKLKEIFDASFYNEAEGGLMGGLGQLFRNGSRLYVYPSLNFETGEVVTAENYPVAPEFAHLYEHLRANGCIRGIQKYDKQLLAIRSRDVLDKIEAADAAWETLVAPEIISVVKKKKLFGWKG